MRVNNIQNLHPTVEFTPEHPDKLRIKLQNLKIERLELENKILKNKVQEILLKRDLNLLGQD